MNVIPSTGINWGFTGTDVLNNATWLIGGLTSFLLLVLAVTFAPYLIGLIKSVFGEEEYLDVDIDDEEEDD